MVPPPDTSIRPDRFVAVLIGGVIVVLAVIVLALGQSDLALVGAMVVLLMTAVVASSTFRLLRNDDA